MDRENVTFEEFERLLECTPVIAVAHPLLPLCLRPDVRILADASDLLVEIDSPAQHRDQPVLVLSSHSEEVMRFPFLQVANHLPVDHLNRNIRHHLAYARDFLLTTHKVAEYITHDVANRPADVVIFCMVDGLSYEDVLHWPCAIVPCFVDGPSVTYRYADEAQKCLLSSVGFASIVNRPSVSARLYELGYHHARGYTYWSPESNEIADFMFEGVPFRRTANFEGILRAIAHDSFAPQMYIQLVRQGLDGLAHGNREVQRIEIEIAVQAILDDIERLLDVMRKNRLTARVYLTSDHGILWKAEHRLQLITGIKKSRSRYAAQRPSEDATDFAVEIRSGEASHYLFCYPYLGHTIPANDAGVHGGLSYQESIVPFAIFED